MTAREIIKELMDKNEITNAVLADRLGLTQAAVWDRLNNKKAKRMTFEVADEILKQLDYKIVIVPRDARVPKEGYVVE